MYNKKNLLVLLLLFAVKPAVFSQNLDETGTDSIKFHRLGEVVVTATRTPSALLRIANSISVIDSEQISNSNSNNVFDLIKNETGVSFTRLGGNGTLSNLYIRGSNSSHTLVLIDGVEVNLTNDPSGVYDFSALPVDNIDRIEVLRGPQSTLYGSDALAGVINIITRKGGGSAKFFLNGEAGSYNSFKGMIGLNGSLRKFNYSASFSRSQSDGYSVASEKYGNTEKDGYVFNNFSSVLGYTLNDDIDINLYTRFIKSQSDNDQFGGLSGDDPTYITDQEEFSIRGEGRMKLFEGDWSQKLGLSFIRNVRKNSFDTSSVSVYSSRALYDGRKYKIDWQNDLKISSTNLFTLGAEIEVEQSASEYYLLSTVLPEYGSVIPFKDTRTIGIFIQDQLRFNKSLFLNIGARLDEHSSFGSYFTYRISPAYMLWETGTKLRISVGTGFKAPSLYYLFDPAYGNENLNPEKSFGFDAGIEQYFFSPDLTAGATFFYNKFTDMFGFDYATFKTINVNQAVTKGGEFFLRIKPIDEIDIKINYTLTDARDTSPGSSGFDKKLLRRPENKAGFLAGFSLNRKMNLNGELIWVGTREDMDFSDYKRIELDGYVLLNVAAHYDVLDILRLNLRIENLLDTDYEEVFGYGTAGLSFYGGVRISLE